MGVFARENIVLRVTAPGSDHDKLSGQKKSCLYFCASTLNLKSQTGLIFSIYSRCLFGLNTIG